MRIKFITLNAINIEVTIAQKNMQFKKKESNTCIKK